MKKIDKYYIREQVQKMRLKRTEAFLFECLLSRANLNTWTCFPGKTKLLQEAHISERTYHRAIQELEKKGLVTRQARFRLDGGQTSNYFMITKDIDGCVKTFIDNQEQPQNENQRTQEIPVLSLEEWVENETGVEKQNKQLTLVQTQKKRPGFRCGKEVRKIEVYQYIQIAKKAILSEVYQHRKHQLERRIIGQVNGAIFWTMGTRTTIWNEKIQKYGVLPKAFSG